VQIGTVRLYNSPCCFALSSSLSRYLGVGALFSAPSPSSVVPWTGATSFMDLPPNRPPSRTNTTTRKQHPHASLWFAKKIRPACLCSRLHYIYSLCSCRTIDMEGSYRASSYGLETASTLNMSSGYECSPSFDSAWSITQRALDAL
jgi:hypothetical protein